MHGTTFMGMGVAPRHEARLLDFRARDARGWVRFPAEHHGSRPRACCLIGRDGFVRSRSHRPVTSLPGDRAGWRMKPSMMTSGRMAC